VFPKQVVFIYFKASIRLFHTALQQVIFRFKARLLLQQSFWSKRLLWLLAQTLPTDEKEAAIWRSFTS